MTTTPQDILREVSEKRGWTTDDQIINLCWFIDELIDQSQHWTLDDFRIFLEQGPRR